LPRSGTTLLSVMLDNHPDIASPPEPWLMLALAEFGRASVRHPADASLLRAAVHSFAGEGGRILAARAAGQALYRAHLERFGKRVFIDKTPRYSLIPEFLIEVFPGARFIWLRRDPMDIAASYMTTWGTDLAAMLSQGRDFPQLFDLTIGLDRLMSFHERFRKPIHVVSYERLVVAPHDELAALLGHVGLGATPAVLDRMMILDTTARPSDAFGDIKIRATSAPHTASIGNWRSVLDRAQLQVLLDALGAVRMVELGYAETVAALEQIGVRQSDPAAPARYRALAEAHLNAREADTVLTTASEGTGLQDVAQARIHAAIAGDQAWMALAAEAFANERSALMARIVETEAESERLQAALAGRDISPTFSFFRRLLQPHGAAKSRADGRLRTGGR
jgi:Sulfotransferase family